MRQKMNLTYLSLRQQGAFTEDRTLLFGCPRGHHNGIQVSMIRTGIHREEFNRVLEVNTHSGVVIGRKGLIFGRLITLEFSKVHLNGRQNYNLVPGNENSFRQRFERRPLKL